MVPNILPKDLSNQGTKDINECPLFAELQENKSHSSILGAIC